MAKRNNSGSVRVRSGTNKLSIRYKGKEIATGLNNTPLGRRVAEEMLQRIHFDYINYKQEPSIKKTTLREAFTLFLDDHCKGLSKNTMRLYILSFRSISPNEYPISDEAIDRDVSRFTSESRDVSKSTILTYLRHYSVFANYCLRKEWIGRFPEKLRTERKVTTRLIKKRHVVVFEKWEFDAMTNYFSATDVEFTLLLLMLWHTGGRIAETLRLTWSQIDMKQRRIRYSNKINQADDDYIPVSSAVESILKQIKALRSAPTTKVFRWEVSSHSRLCRRLNDAMKKLGIEKQGRGFHAIRRTFATNLIDSDVSLADVKDLMRHKDITTTLEHYKAKHGRRLESILESNIVHSTTAPKME